jgi:hypothetical protein
MVLQSTTTAPGPRTELAVPAEHLGSIFTDAT